MLEALLPSQKLAPTTEGTINFLLTDFSTVADIVDKGPLGIAVSKGANLTVGQDSRGKYVNMPGSSWSDIITFFSTALNCQEVEINMTIADIGETGGQYGSLIFDNRPPSSNTNFILWLVYTTNSTGFDREFALNVNNTAVNDASHRKFSTTDLLRIKIKAKTTGTVVYVNDQLIMSTPTKIPSFNGQYAGIGRHAFAGVTGTAPLKAKLYHFEIRKIS